MQITINRDECIGCGNCESIAPDVFALDDEGIATVTNPAGAEDSVIQEAAESCPVGAIMLCDDAGARIYP